MLSPLRYPGGKAKLFSYFVEIIKNNSLYDKIYAEPYAGGAGLALKLLAHGYVSRIELNDIDPAIVAFWRSVLEEPDRLCSLIDGVELSVDEWRRQRSIYRDGPNVGQLQLGFAAYYLNRTSRSGIIEGSGPIGGYSQSGNWKIDARFNRKSQISQINEISRFKSSIEIHSLDAVDFIVPRLKSSDYFIYLDPPYYVKGSALYKNSYKHEDHEQIRGVLEQHRAANWVLSYDFVKEIVALYDKFDPLIYSLNYSAGKVGTGQEVIYCGDSIVLPEWQAGRRAA